MAQWDNTLNARYRNVLLVTNETATSFTSIPTKVVSGAYNYICSFSQEFVANKVTLTIQGSLDGTNWFDLEPTSRSVTAISPNNTGKPVDAAAYPTDEQFMVWSIGVGCNEPLYNQIRLKVDLVSRVADDGGFTIILEETMLRYSEEANGNPRGL